MTVAMTVKKYHILSAAGSTWTNVTENTVQPLMCKHCLSLKLNKNKKAKKGKETDRWDQMVKIAIYGVSYVVSKIS